MEKISIIHVTVQITSW